MTFNGGEHLERPVTRFTGFYPAEVIDDQADPLSSGKVKVRGFPMMEGIDVAVLPWAAPAFPLFEGAASDQGSYVVPAIGSRVWVFFSAGDFNLPVYFANCPGKTDGPSGRTPGKTIYKSRSGHTVTLDDNSGEIKVESSGGGVITMEADGDIMIKGAAKVVIDPKCEIGVTGPYGKCVTTLTLPNCFFSGSPIPGTDKLKSES